VNATQRDLLLGERLHHIATEQKAADSVTLPQERDAQGRPVTGIHQPSAGDALGAGG
jgi:hypothetical protein